MTKSTDVELVEAVNRLTSVVTKLDSLLRDEYPKRSEVERRFVTKLESKNYTVRLVVVALLTVIGCYTLTVGSYSACLVGETSLGACKFVPGYQERVDRRKEVDSKIADIEARVLLMERNK